MNTYKARYWREGDTWEVELVDDPRVHTFASTLGRARRYIREATAAMYDLDETEVNIVDLVELPNKLGGRVDDLRKRRAELEAANADLAAATRALTAELAAAGLSVRDTGELVHLSAQRVSQIAAQRVAKVAGSEGMIVRELKTGERPKKVRKGTATRQGAKVRGKA